jgi:hypothetical protein
MRRPWVLKIIFGISVLSASGTLFANVTTAAEVDRLRCETILGIEAAQGRDAYQAERRAFVLIEESQKALATEFRRRLEDVGYIARLKKYYERYRKLSTAERIAFKKENAPELMREYAGLVRTFMQKYHPKASDPSSVFSGEERYESFPQRIQAEHGRMAEIKPVTKAKYVRYRNAEKVANPALGPESMVWSSSLNWLQGDFDGKRRAILSRGASVEPNVVPTFEEYATGLIVNDKDNVEELPHRVLFEGSADVLGKGPKASRTSASLDLITGEFTSYQVRKKSNLLAGDWKAFDPKSAEKAEEDAYVARLLAEKGYAKDLAECVKVKEFAERAKVYTGALAKQDEAISTNGTAADPSTGKSEKKTRKSN